MFWTEGSSGSPERAPHTKTHEHQSKMSKEKIELKVVKPWTEDDKLEHAAKVGGMRNLIEVEVETDDGFQFCYLVKKPGRKEVQAIGAAAEKKDITTVQKITMGCVLEGDKDAYEYDGAVYVQLLQQIGDLVNNARSHIKK